MIDLGLYKPVCLTDQQTKELEGLMAEAFVALSSAAKEKYGFPNTRQLRDDYKQDSRVLWFDPRARNFMNRMIAVESLVINGFIKLCVKLCNKFHATSSQRPGIEYMDYVQPCADAIYYCMYGYNGENSFSTYVRIVMRSRLASLVRDKEGPQARFHGQSIDHEAMEIGVTDNPRDEIDAMRKAIEVADLTPIQREIIAALLDGEKRVSTNWSKTRINPNTGELYTKQVLSRLYREACQVIKETYEKLYRKAA
jgi:hypothetical protein